MASLTMSYFRRILNFGLNKILEAPADLGCRIVALPPVASRLDANYEKAKREYARHVPLIVGDDQTIIDELRTNGVFVTSLEQLNIPGTEYFLEKADALERQHLPLQRSFQAGADAI